MAESPDDAHRASSKPGSRKAKAMEKVKPKKSPVEKPKAAAKAKASAPQRPKSKPAPTRPKAKPTPPVKATAKADSGAGAAGTQTTKAKADLSGASLPTRSGANKGSPRPVGKPTVSNPSYTGKSGGPTGPQGRMNTPSRGVGGPAIGRSPRGMITRGRNPLMPTRFDEMRNMAKGGMVSKQGPAKGPRGRC